MPTKFNVFTGNFDLTSAGDGDTVGDLSSTKGNLVVGNGTIWTTLGVGTNGTTLTADSGEATGVKWATPAGGGDVVKVGTPVDGQVGVWTGDGTIEGDAAFTFDTTTDSLVIAASGSLDFGAVTILSDSAGTMTLSNVDALDATTDSTITSALSDSYQPLDGTLTALAAYNTNGIITQTAADTFTGRTITGTTNEITVTDGDGVSGNPTLSLPATIDLGGKTSLEIPNSATPTVNADGEIAVDTTVTDFSHGVLKYYGGEEMGVVAMPIAQFTSPTDDYVVTYNATNDEFELQAGGGGALAVDNKFWEARNLDASYTPIAPLEQDTTTNIIKKARAFDYATIEYCNSSYYVPSDIDTSGTVTFYVFWQARTAPASDENVVWQVEHAAVADAEDLDSATFTAEVATAAATSTVQNQMNYTTWTETVSNLGWAVADEVFLKWSRKSTDANDTFDTRATTADDALAFKFGMLVPRA